jgi:hypothetical protein
MGMHQQWIIFIKTLLRGNPVFTPPENKLIFQMTQNFIKNTERFP